MSAPEPITTPASVTRPLKVCLLGYRSHPYGGGQGVYLRYLSKALVDIGCEVDVISGQPYPQLDEGVHLIKMPGLNLYENGLAAFSFKQMGSLTNWLEWLSKLTGGFAEPYCFGRRVHQYLKRHRADYDVVHDNQSLSYGVLKLQAILPLVMTIHHPITSDYRIALDACERLTERLLVKRWYSFLRMQKKVASKLHNIITVSKLSRADIARDFAIPAEHISVLYNGIDTQVFKPLPDVARKPWRIMATASADQPMKGLAYLIKAYAELVPEYPQLELLVVGKPKPDGQTMRLLKRLQLETKIQFVSGVSTTELVKLYAQASVVVVPSLYEGFGLPAGEAMACGVPLISTTGGALPEVVGDAGITIKPGSVSAIKDALVQVLNDERLRERLAQAGREHIQAHFCWAKLARQVSAYYCAAIQQHESGAVLPAQPLTEKAP